MLMSKNVNNYVIKDSPAILKFENRESQKRPRSEHNDTLHGRENIPSNSNTNTQ